MGRLIVISGPSGIGKTTVCNDLLKEMPCLLHSISCTTRLPRPGEHNGNDYFFLSKEEFQQRLAAGKFLEHAIVFDHYYGTDKEWIMTQLAQGKDIILNIDVQGASQIKKSYPEAILIFLMPPSLEELQRRLQGRATDDLEEISKRLDMAKQEMAQVNNYDYTVINDELAETVRKIKEIIGLPE